MQPDGRACYFLKVRETNLVWRFSDREMVAHPERVRSARCAAQPNQNELRRFLQRRFCLRLFCGHVRATQYLQQASLGGLRELGEERRRDAVIVECDLVVAAESTSKQRPTLVRYTLAAEWQRRRKPD